MNVLLFASITSTLLGWLMGFLSVFLILLVLIQRGRGGGLTGALGGPGGQSAFGSKAGDTFTVITVVVASVWGFSCAFTMWLLGTHTPRTTDSGPDVRPGPAERRELDDERARSLPSDAIGGLLSDDEAESAADGEGAAGEATDADLELTPAAPAPTDGEPASANEPPASANETPVTSDEESASSDEGANATDAAASGADAELPPTDDKTPE